MNYLESCVSCDEIIDLDVDEYYLDESIYTYWCNCCGDKEMDDEKFEWKRKKLKIPYQTIRKCNNDYL